MNAEKAFDEWLDLNPHFKSYLMYYKDDPAVYEFVHKCAIDMFAAGQAEGRKATIDSLYEITTDTTDEIDRAVKKGIEFLDNAIRQQESE